LAPSVAIWRNCDALRHDRGRHELEAAGEEPALREERAGLADSLFGLRERLLGDK